MDGHHGNGNAHDHYHSRSVHLSTSVKTNNRTLPVEIQAGRSDTRTAGHVRNGLDDVQKRWLSACRQYHSNKCFNCWDGLFLSRYTWTPSFVFDWLERKIEDKCTFQRMELFPPTYHRWIQNTEIKRVLTKSIRLWIIHVIGEQVRRSTKSDQKPNQFIQSSNIVDYRTILQLCFDLRLHVECSIVYKHAMKQHKQWTWQQLAFLHSVW
jgi:hypothetical protein